MKLDGKLKHRLQELYTDLKERNSITSMLRQLRYDQRKFGLVCAKRIDETVVIGDDTLVITADKVGMGWPIKRLLWARPRMMN